jgi:anthranilate synthase component 2
MILMIDNYDSFTYNIVQYSKELGADLKVVRSDELSLDEIEELNPDKILLSPGPSTPDEAGVTLGAVERFAGEKPMFGICLGHQSIAQAFGAKIVQAKNMMHGKTSSVRVVRNSLIFKGVPSEFRATRYHSLVIEQSNLPNLIVPTAYSQDDNEIMAIEIKGFDIYGVQFHPESIMSENGKEMLNNFLKI